MAPSRVGDPRPRLMAVTLRLRKRVQRTKSGLSASFTLFYPETISSCPKQPDPELKPANAANLSATRCTALWRIRPGCGHFFVLFVGLKSKRNRCIAMGGLGRPTSGIKSSPCSSYPTSGMARIRSTCASKDRLATGQMRSSTSSYASDTQSSSVPSGNEVITCMILASRFSLWAFNCAIAVLA